MNIIFFGQQGAGKGQYAQHFGKYGFAHISTGELLREEAKNKTKIGRKIEKTMNEGKLVLDDIVADVLKRKIEGCEKFILDGYPRNMKQTELLEKILEHLGRKIDLAVNFVVSDETSLERLGSRRTCSICGWVCNLKNIPPKVSGKCDECGGMLYQREDDKPEAIKKRIKLYKKEIKPVLDFYRKILVEVGADRGHEEVIKDIEEIIRKCATKEQLS